MPGGLKKRARQVRAESNLRFAPQRRQLRAARRDVDSDYETDVAVAKQTARGAKRTARAAKPSIAKAINTALATTTEGPTPGVSAALGNLGPAAARDSEGATRRLSETLAMTKAELDQRVIDAEAGKSSAIRQAGVQRKSERGRLRDQFKGLAADEGTFRQSRAGELGEAAKERGVKKRGQDLTLKGKREGTKAQGDRDAANRASREKIAADKLAADKEKAGKKKKATGPQSQSAQSAISLARTQIQRLVSKEGKGRGEIGPLLVEGRDDMTLKVDKEGKPLAQPVKVPGVKKVDQLWASVALDIEIDGQLSRANLARLRKLGYGANMLGVGKYKPKSKAQQRAAGDKAANKSPGSDSSQRPGANTK